MAKRNPTHDSHWNMAKDDLRIGRGELRRSKSLSLDEWNTSEKLEAAMNALEHAAKARVQATMAKGGGLHGWEEEEAANKLRKEAAEEIRKIVWAPLGNAGKKRNPQTRGEKRKRRGRLDAKATLRKAMRGT